MNGRMRFLSNIPPVVKNLLIINILMFLLAMIAERGFGVDLNRALGLHYFRSEYFQPYQFVTHMFMHGGVTHIFLNMFMLWMFGRFLEQVWGGKRFLIYYFFTGLGAAALHTFVMHIELSGLINDAVAFSNTPSADVFAAFVRDNVPRSSPQLYDFIQAWIADPNNSSYAREAIGFVDQFVNAKMNIPTVGASGAVYGVLLAFGVLFPNMPLVLIFLPFFPIKAKYMVMGMAVLELVHGFTMPGSNVAHFAHLGGMLFGFILIRYWNKTTKKLY